MKSKQSKMHVQIPELKSYPNPVRQYIPNKDLKFADIGYEDCIFKSI